MVKMAYQIDAANLGYDPLALNSNSVINTVLLAAGLNPVPNDTDYPWAPGFWTPGGSVDLRTFDLTRKYGVDEPGQSVELSFYQPTFGIGRGGRLGGFVSAGYESGGGGGSYTGGTSGHWHRIQVGSDDWEWHYVEAKATRINPVVLDLDGDGVELTRAENSPGFDFFGEGLTKTIGWFTGGDALLVHDVNGNGFVDNGAEFSFIHHAPGSTSDLQALRVFDVNANGWLDPDDGAYSQLRLWRDANFNGISDAGELTTLQALGVQAINLHGSGGGYQVAGNDIIGTSAFTRTDGSTGTAYNVGFAAFSRGTRLVSENADWAVLTTEGGEEIGVFKHDAPLYIENLARFEVNGDTRIGYQLGDGNDFVGLGSYGAWTFYLDTSGGDDRIDLASSTGGSVIKAGAGNDSVTTGRGDDYISTGSGAYDILRDWGRRRLLHHPVEQ